MSDQVIKLLDRFLYRDFFYALAGAIIVRVGAGSFIDVDGYYSRADTVTLILWAGAFYVIGLINQELWSQLPFIGNGESYTYGRFMRGVFRRHEGREWKDGRDAAGRVHTLLPDHYQRAIDLKQVGNSIGTACLTCSILNFASIIVGISTEKSISIGIGMGLAATTLLLMGRLHSMRQADHHLNGLSASEKTKG